MSLDKCRSEIDNLDKSILELLNKRAQYAARIGQIKAEGNAPVFVPGREESVFRKLEANNTGPLSNEAIRYIYREIISASIATEKKLTIAFLGPEGTYTQQAAWRAFGSSVCYRPMPSIEDVFTAVARSEADYGVIPSENTSEGSVINTLDMFIDSDLKIISQIYLDISHNLIGHGSLKDIKYVKSKDQAIGQCRNWLRRHLPEAEYIHTNSTTAAVKEAANDPSIAAIGSEAAAHLYGVPIIESGIQDKKENITRFFTISREAAPITPGMQYKTTILIAINNEPGTLVKTLETFQKRSINLTKIESRPSRRRIWEYFFYIDFIGHHEDPEVKATLKELAESCVMVKWLGSYLK